VSALSPQMLQATKQEAEQKRRDTRFQPGVSGNPRGRESTATRAERRDAIIARWAEAVGGVEQLTAAQRDLLAIAAVLTMQRPKAEDAVRVANSVARILSQCGVVTKARHSTLKKLVRF
jgi:hypothetical protein